MKFCDKCGSYMEKAMGGFQCPRCGSVELSTSHVFNKRSNEAESKVYVVDNTMGGYLKVNHICPECGNPYAYRIIATSSGEHAGVKQDRSVQRYKCTKCLHPWTES